MICPDCKNKANWRPSEFIWLRKELLEFGNGFDEKIVQCPYCGKRNFSLSMIGMSIYEEVQQRKNYKSN